VRKITRSAKSGRFVAALEAFRNPAGTVTEMVEDERQAAVSLAYWALSEDPDRARGRLTAIGALEPYAKGMFRG
jgi:hypothetical protein